MPIVEAHHPERLIHVRFLFLQYAQSLDLNLCFQNFERELAELPGRYAPPEGRLLLALENDQPLGCVALRKLDADICEMKRMYVRPAFQGRGLGRTLAHEIITAARQIGYRRMRLDTLSDMSPALALYASLGFQRIPAYYANPSDRAVFMELIL